MKIYKKIICAALAVLLLCGCGSVDAEPVEPEVQDAPQSPAISDELANVEVPDNRLIDSVFSLYYESAEPLNPYKTTNRHNTLIAQLMYEGLYELDAGFEAQPVIAASYETEDNISFEFLINPGRRFSDGSSLTAEDVVYSVNTARDSGLYASRLADIVSCTALGRYSFNITLSAPNCRLECLLDFPVIPVDSLTEACPAGSGPYEFVRGSEYAYLRPNEYWDGEGELRQLYLYEDASGLKTSYFESGQTDIVVSEPLEAGALSYGGDYELTRYDTSVMHYLGVNLQGELGLPELRQIISAVIDREDIAIDALESAVRPAALPINPVSEDYNDRIAKQYSYSLERAAKLLEGFELSDTDEDGAIEVTHEGDDYELELTLIVNSESSYRCAAARQIAEQLSVMGILVHVEELYWKDYVKALERGEFDLYYGVTMMSADFDLDPLLSPTGEMNYSLGYDYDYGGLSAAWKSSGRASDLNSLLRAVCEFGQIIPLAFERHEIITHRNVIHGMQPTQHNVFAGVENWTIE